MDGQIGPDRGAEGPLFEQTEGCVAGAAGCTMHRMPPLSRPFKFHLVLTAAPLLFVGCTSPRDWYADPGAAEGAPYKGCSALMESDGSPFSELTYNDEGYLLTEVFGSDGDDSTQLTYDDDGTTRLTWTWTGSTGTSTARYTYDRGLLSHVDWTIDGEDASTVDYAYGEADRRDTVHTVDVAEDLDETETWTWTDGDDGSVKAIVTSDVSEQVQSYSWDRNRFLLEWTTDGPGAVSS